MSLPMLADALGTFIGISSIIAFFAAIAGLGFYFERKRREALRAVANELHLEFFAKGEGFNLAELSQFHLTTQGHSRGARNLMRGQAHGIAVEIFDYSFTIGSGKNSATTRSSVARFRSPGLSLPVFQLRPEGFFSKLGAALGMQDIDFAEHPKFSDRFVLKGKDEAAIRRLFDAELITSLEGINGMSVEGAGDQLLVYRAGKMSKPEQIRSLFEDAFRILTRFADAGKRTGFASMSNP